MTFKEFKDKHQGSKIIVCGCGESALQLKDRDLPGIILVGVNDFSRLRTPDYLLVINVKSGFKDDRWHWIENTQCPHVFTHLDKLEIPEEKKIVFKLGRYGGVDLDKPTMDYTSNSPFMGVILAYHLGAKKIGLVGVDFHSGGSHFFAKTGDHVLNRRSNEISKEYQRLHAALAVKGTEFYNLSSLSKIDIPKMSVENFIGF